MKNLKLPFNVGSKTLISIIKINLGVWERQAERKREMNIASATHTYTHTNRITFKKSSVS